MFQFNQLAHENQIGQYIREKYSDRTVAAAHMWRYFEMNWFLLNNTISIQQDREREDPAVVTIHPDQADTLIKWLQEVKAEFLD